jgi:HPt (histidine-containing phosphotransfer) domain-containing protein
MNGHLSKPVDPKRLRQALDKVAHGKLDNPVQLSEPVETPKPMTKVQIPRSNDVPDSKGSEDSFTRRTVAPDDDQDQTAFLNQQYGGSSKAKPASMVMGASGEPVFDDSTLAPLKGAMGKDDLQGMIDGLFVKLDEIMAAINGHGQDKDALGASAHDLKGMAGNFGLKELSHLAMTLEDNLDNADAAEKLLAQMNEADKHARTVLQDWLDRG